MDVLLAPIPGADRRPVGSVESETVTAGSGRIQRVVDPPGLRWCTHMRPLLGAPLCLHAHVGFPARGHVQDACGDRCRVEFRAPAAVVLEPGHDAWVVGEEPGVPVQRDCPGRAPGHLGLPAEHRHP